MNKDYRLLFISIFVLLMVWILCHEAYADPAKEKTKVCWEAPVVNSDGTPILSGEVINYKVYYKPKDVGNVTYSFGDPDSYDAGTNLCATFISMGISPNNMLFAVTAYDLVLNESGYSSEVQKNPFVTKGKPKNTIIE